MTITKVNNGSATRSFASSKNYLICMCFLMFGNISYSQSIFDKVEKYLKDKKFEISYGPQDVWFKRSYVRYVHPEYGRDIEFQSVYGHGNDDLDFLFKGEFGVPMYTIDFGFDLSENYSLIVRASHLTYEVDVDQTYYRIGKWNGANVSDSIYLRNHISRLEHSNGMNIWNLGVRRNFNIGFKENENLDLSYAVTPNVGLVFTASQGSILNPEGIWEHYNQGNAISGYNYAVNNELEVTIKKHLLFKLNLNYFQMIINKALLTDGAYLKHKLRGLNYGLAFGYKF